MVRSSSNHDPLQAALAWLADDGSAALATVVSTWGSAPVPAGGQMAVARDGRFAGSVSGGCIEADVISEAQDVIAKGRAKVLDFGVSDDIAWRTGLACGGKLSVYIEPLTRERDTADLETILQARAARAPLVVSTRLADGQRSFVTPSGNTSPDVTRCFASGESVLSGEGNARVFFQALMPIVHLVIAGATETGQVLGAVAQRLGWKITIVDPREAFASEDRFAGFDTNVAWPGEALAGLALDARTAVVALTHAGHIDDEALAAALASPCFYVGALGSRKTHAARVERLKAAGLSADAIARIRAPVGLDIKAKTPGEIAVSIAAEIIATQRGG